jgi:hypothetical protein
VRQKIVGSAHPTIFYIKKRKQDRIIEVIQLIYSISPFEIISAEESYMDAKFIENISKTIMRDNSFWLHWG